MSAVPPEIESAITKSLAAQKRIVQSTPGLDNALTNTAAQGLPDIAVSPAAGQYLALLCKSINAKRVLEIGTLGGYSTIWFAGAMPEMKVTSIELNSKHREVALSNIKTAGLESKVEIILGAALDVLPTLADKGEQFDLVFIDAAWHEQAQYFDHAVRLTRKGGIVFVDNAVRQLTESEEGDPDAEALIEEVRRKQEEGKVLASLVPTLNTHKVSLSGIADGFLMACVL
jgi:predicted O-methyltransferase YrrM